VVGASRAFQGFPDTGDVSGVAVLNVTEIHVGQAVPIGLEQGAANLGDWQSSVTLAVAVRKEGRDAGCLV
jgi:hypothetical protein